MGSITGRQWLVVNDADRLGRDPAMRRIVGGRAVAKQAASTSQMGRFETEVLTRAENLVALAYLPGRWIDTVHSRPPGEGGGAGHGQQRQPHLW